jgi:hypothetical protein
MYSRSFWILWCLALGLLLADTRSARAEFKAGAARIDITPETLPVLVNGGMTSRSVDKIKTRIHARAVAMTDGRTQLAIVVVDTCMMGRAFLDEVKALAAQRTGIPRDRILISAVHAHSVPSVVGCLGTEPDPVYVPFLRARLVEAIAAAQAAMEPARVGCAVANAAQFTALRRWIRRPDRVVEDPFGNPTVRANMHAGANWDNVTGESGPEDPDLMLIAFQARDGRPLAVLANFSMHYFGDTDISADYFGLFCEGLRARIAPQSPGGKAAFVGLMSHGCSGDIWRRDYTRPASEWNAKLTIEDYTNALLEVAMKAYRTIRYSEPTELAMAERRMTLPRRVPDKQRLEWAQRIVTEMGPRPPKTLAEVYAREQLLLDKEPAIEVVTQALRIGTIGIATTSCETYAVTGLKIKAASPLVPTMVIELANGGDGYIPPPEQHLFGGYNTWPARSAGLEVMAEPKVAESAIGLLEKVSARPRRAWRLNNGPAACAVLAARPWAYWRLNEFTGPQAADATEQNHDAVYEPAITYYLEGPCSAAFCTAGETNRAPHLVGGRIRARVPGLGDHYSVSLWLWNGMPNDGRDTSGWLFSRGREHSLAGGGDHLGIGGRSGHCGQLVFFHGDNPASAVAGKSVIPRWQWQHVVLVRDGQTVRVYLNGQLEIEAHGMAPSPADLEHCFFGGRSDNEANWEGRLDEIAVFPRALTAVEAARLTAK